MKKIHLGCLAFILAAGLAHADSLPCNGFQIKVKNDTADDMLIHRIRLNGAKLQPDTLQKLNSHQEQVFTVNNSADGVEMYGDLVFHSISVPTKKVAIKFTLSNKTVFCSHDDKGSYSDYHLKTSRVPGNVTYTIK